MSQAIDMDDELAMLLAAPTVLKKDWGDQGQAHLAKSREAELGTVQRKSDQNVAKPEERQPETIQTRDGERRKRRRRRRRSSSGSHRSMSGKRRHRQKRSEEVEAVTPQMPAPGTTWVFDPHEDAPQDIPEPELRKMASVPMFEWVSVDSVADLNMCSFSARRRTDEDKDGKLRSNEKPEKFSATAWEESREKIGLKLLGELAGPLVSKQWQYILSDESRRSYAGLLQKPSELLPHLGEFFQRIKDGTHWKQPEGPMGALPRKTGWMVKSNCTCMYRYGGVEVAPEGFPTWMTDLMKLVMPLCGLLPENWPNACNLNLYEDGGMSVGWHSDDERLFQGRFQDCRIISLSLGVERRFEMRLNWPEEKEQGIRRVRLGNGDILTMEGMTQKHFQHRVPREENVRAPRINLTWRYVLKHDPRCPAGRSRRT